MVELGRRAAVDSDRRDARLLHPPRKRRRDLLPDASSTADLTSHGHLSLGQTRPDDRGGTFGLVEQGRPLSPACDLAHGTGHVDVDERQALPQTLGNGGGRLAKLLGLAPEELYRQLRLAPDGKRELPGLGTAVVDARHGDHLAIGECRPARTGHEAPGTVCDARHRRHEKGVVREALRQRPRGEKALDHRREPCGGCVGAEQLVWPGTRLRPHPSPTLSTARKASCGTSTEPMAFMRLLPSFCFSSSLRLREMSPP